MLGQNASLGTVIIYIAVFVGVLMLFEGLRQGFGSGETASRTRNRRMRMIARGASTEQVLNLLKDDRKEAGMLARMRSTLAQSGLPIGFAGLGLIAMVIGGLAFLFSALILPMLLAGALAMVLAAGIPWAVVLSARSKRLNKLVQQMPEALDLMSRGLRVGHPLNVTIKSVATDMPDPIGTEFGIIEDQISYGDTVVDAFGDFAERIDLEDIRYLAVSVGIQHGSGGNLAHVLQVLSKVIRDRATMKKKIVAISAEGRFSAVILTLLPFGIFGAISLSSPDYYGAVQDDPLFLPTMLAILSLIFLQAVVLFRLVSFKF